MKPFTSDEVAAKFASYPPKVRTKLLALRSLILSTAQSMPEVGEIQETLKWGEPAYVTQSKAGSTVRIDWKEKAPNQYAMYFNCQTSLVETFRSLFPNDFQFEGNRALLFEMDKPIPKDTLAFCIAAALTYHVKKTAKSR